MSLTTPIVPESMTPFPATEEFIFRFNVISGNQVVANEVEIQNNSDSQQVYLEKIDSFQFQHIIPANTLTNNNEYKLRVRTFDVDNNSSDWSDWVVFYCFSRPEVEITNIIDGVVNNQTYVFLGEYTHPSEPIQSYRFILYNENNNLIQSYPEQFSEIISQEVAGLQNDVNYKIELRVITARGMEATTGLIPFLAKYIQPRLASVINLENFESQASIKVSANIIEIYGEIGSGSISYIDGEWINLHDGMVYFQEGVNFLDSNFTMSIWVKDIVVDEYFMEFIGEEGRVKLRLEDDGKIHVYKILDAGGDAGGVYYHTASNEVINPTMESNMFVFFQHVNNYCNIRTELLA